MPKSVVTHQATIAIPDALAGVGFIPAIQKPKPGTPAHLGLSYLETIRARTAAFETLTKLMEAEVIDAATEKAASDLSELVSLEIRLHGAIKRSNPDVITEDLKAHGIIRPWEDLVADARMGNIALETTAMIIEPGDTIEFGQEDGPMISARITRGDEQASLLVREGSYEHNLIRAAIDDLPEPDVGFTL